MPYISPIPNAQIKVRPFLKWPGGKYRLLDTLNLYLPEGKILVEPFVGAGSVFLNSTYSKFILNDINKDLIQLFNFIKRDSVIFTQDAKKLFIPKNNEAKRYYKLRDKFNNETDAFERAKLFLYLNRHGYNGLCRYNLNGKFNVPFGAYKKPYFPEKELNFFSNKLKKCNLSSQSFLNCIDKACKRYAPEDLVIYCDPPYAPLSYSANFTGYAAEKFTLQNQAELASAALKASQQGAYVIISNHDTPFTREIYKNANIISFKVQRAISCKGQNRAKVKELLALYEPNTIR